MVSIREEVKDLQVHVLKWNEQLHNIEKSQGLFMFRINDGASGIFDPKFSASLFELECLSIPDSTEYLVSEAFNGRTFYYDDTTVRVVKEVSEYLLSCFKFDIQTLHQKPTIVIVVDVYVSTTMTYTRKRVAPSPPHPWRKRIIKQKAVDDDDKGVKSRLHSECGPAKLPAQDVQDIRVVLMTFLDEPALMRVKPVVSHERQGLHQVEATTMVRVFDGDDEVVHDCSICLEGICGGTMVVETPCSHMFHRDCLFKWLSKTNSCPYCRSFCATVV